MIKTVFFDLYYTLACFKPSREEIQIEACKEFGIKLSLNSLIRANFVADSYFYAENARLPVFKRPPEEQFSFMVEYQKMLLKESGIDFSNELAAQIYQKAHQVDKQLVLYEDAIPTFQMLKQSGITLGLISNIDRDKGPVEELGLASYLDFITTSPPDGKGKPHPQIFFEALRQAGIQANDAIHIGDQYEIDVVGARGVGITPVLLDRYHIMGEITDCLKIYNLTEIISHLAI